MCGTVYSLTVVLDTATANKWAMPHKKSVLSQTVHIQADLPFGARKCLSENRKGDLRSAVSAGSETRAERGERGIGDRSRGSLAEVVK